MSACLAAAVGTLPRPNAAEARDGVPRIPAACQPARSSLSPSGGGDVRGFPISIRGVRSADVVGLKCGGTYGSA